MNILENVKGRILIFIFSSIFAICSPFQSGAATSNLSLGYVKGQLTIRVENMPLGALLEGIRDKTGVEIEAGQEIPNPNISIDLGPLPLVEILQRIFTHLNFSFTFILDAENRLQKVWLLDNAATNEKINAPKTEGSKEGGEPGIVNTAKMILLPAIEKMVIQPGGIEMVIDEPLAEMIIDPPVEKTMDIFPPVARMVIE